MNGTRALIFDSGLGGITVLDAVLAARQDLEIIYLADDAFFPYGARPEHEILARVEKVIGDAIASEKPDIVVIACNTASTIVLPSLRALWPGVPFVGTVPAIKPAVALSRSKRISVLATPGTVARDYTRGLIRDHAGECEVTLVGSHHLATLAEADMRGAPVSDADVAAEIAPCFVDKGDSRTDAVVLACTHYPLLLSRLERLAPWPVHYVDPAPAIARRVDALLPARANHRSARPPRLLFTGRSAPDAILVARYAFTRCQLLFPPP